MDLVWFGLWCLAPQEYFSYIVAVSFIGGGNRRKPPTFRKPLWTIVNKDIKFEFIFSDPRFILGIILFAVGYIINKWADWKLRSLRNRKGDDGKL